jgi:4'-phosphopantetheinyl transferase EntD
VPLPPGVIELVAMPTERRHLADLHGVHPEVRWDTVLFSAKESVYKAWFPLTFRWLGFTDAAIEINDACGTFTAHLVEDAILDDRSLARISGRWLVKRGLVLTAVTVPPLA